MSWIFSNESLSEGKEIYQFDIFIAIVDVLSSVRTHKNIQEWSSRVEYIT